MNEGKLQTQRHEWFAELAPFYRLCSVSWVIAMINLSFSVGIRLAGTMRTQFHGQFQDSFAVFALCFSAAVFIAIVIHSSVAIKDAQIATMGNMAQITPSKRLSGQLRGLEKSIMAFLPEGVRAKFVMVVADASSMRTERSYSAHSGETSEALVVITTGLWGEGIDESEMQATIAHEAGHIVAGDVEMFQGLLSRSRALSKSTTILLPVLLVLNFFSATQNAIVKTSTFPVFVLLGLGAVLLSWSALIVAREIQADAYAVSVLGNDVSLKSFYMRRLASRVNERIRFKDRLWRWAVQPDLRWRVSLPALRGELGSRTEIMLSAGLGIFVANGVCSAFFVNWITHMTALFWVLLLAVGAYAIFLAFQFSWWRIDASRLTRSTWKETLASWFRFTIPMTVVVFLFLVLITLSAGPMLPWPSSFSKVAFIGILTGVFQVLGLAVTLVAAFARTIDLHLNRSRPSIGAALIATLLTAGMAILTVWVKTYVGALFDVDVTVGIGLDLVGVLCVFLSSSLALRHYIRVRVGSALKH